MLLENAGAITTHEEIQRRLWPVEFDHSLNANIRKLRVALGDSADNPKYIETVLRIQRPSGDLWVIWITDSFEASCGSLAVL
jgi:hypothetical protein